LIKTGGESVLVNILTVVDDMERGIDAMSNTEDVKAVREGMELIHDKFTNFLKQNGISEIETKGKDFDCDLHEAIATIPATDETMKGKITDCAQKGYYLHGKVIRFAKVVVGK
jgi:molecular chaperone GrpE